MSGQERRDTGLLVEPIEQWGTSEDLGFQAAELAPRPVHPAEVLRYRRLSTSGRGRFPPAKHPEVYPLTWMGEPTGILDAPAVERKAHVWTAVVERENAL